ncbi:MAG TPA: SDR family NAD(P)-dependent oxidoreductase [Trebonia sp.]|nr:SDR family NAD(P)-dependent oxidoreductase [Trebonia sp.]
MRIEPGRVAAVTGGASGIGYALAAAAASRGLRVVLSDVRSDALDTAAGPEDDDRTEGQRFPRRAAARLRATGRWSSGG